MRSGSADRFDFYYVFEFEFGILVGGADVELFSGEVLFRCGAHDLAACPGVEFVNYCVAEGDYLWWMNMVSSKES